MSISEADLLRECTDEELAERLTDMFFYLLENLGLGELLSFVDYESEVAEMLAFLEGEHKPMEEYLS